MDKFHHIPQSSVNFHEFNLDTLTASISVLHLVLRIGGISILEIDNLDISNMYIQRFNHGLFDLRTEIFDILVLACSLQTHVLLMCH